MSYTKMGYSNGKMIPSADITSISSRGSVINGTDFTAYELDVRDTDAVMLTHKATAENTSAGYIQSGTSLTFNYAFSPDNGKTGAKQWNGFSSPAVSFTLGIFGSGTGAGGSIIDSTVANMEGVGWLKLNSIDNTNYSCNVNTVNVTFGKSW